jgi:serine/threonine-protein kinase
MQPCPDRARLERWLDLPTGEAEQSELARHIDGCPACQRLLDELTGGDQGSTSKLETEAFSLPSRLRKPVPRPDQAAPEPAAPPAATEAAAGAFGTPPRHENEIRDLLHRRLFVAAAVGTVVLAGLFLLEATHEADQATAAGSTAASLALAGGGALAFLGMTAFLWRRRAAPLRRLRLLELLMVGVMVVWSANYRWAVLTRGTARTFEGPEHQAVFVEQALLLSNFQWYCHILAYGLFIPNTARRCVAVVAVIALAPLAVTVAAALESEAVRARLPLLLSTTAMGLLLAASLAVYGSFKISTLSQEAFDARRVGPYQLRRKLGAGGMGEVYLAEHRLLKRPCAIKFIRPELAADPSALRRFEREAHAAARLRHPNTVAVFDFGRTESGAFYYVMEHLSGLSLDELAKRHGPLPPERVVHFLRQLCGALGEAHGVGLVHRDIKPSNVFVSTQGGRHDVAKLLDFGLVRTSAEGPDASRLTTVGTVMGTPAFLSPEQARGAEQLDARSDLYSLGAVAYFLLTGRPPFPRPTVAETLVAHLHEPPPPLTGASDAPPGLQAAVLRCLAKDPDERFPDAGSLDAELAAHPCAAPWTEGRAAEWWRQHATDGGP